MASTRVLRNLQGSSQSEVNNNPQLCSEPNVTTKNRFKALENLCEDFCAKEPDDVFENVSNLRTVDKEENNENKLGLSSAKLRTQLASPARSIHLSPSLYL